MEPSTIAIGLALLLMLLICLLIPKHEREEQDGQVKLPVAIAGDQGSAIEAELLRLTGFGRSSWMRFISERIVACTDADSMSDPAVWQMELSWAIWERVRTRIDLNVVDENIVTAKVAALVLLLWSVRVTRAKAYDSRRMLSERKRALAHLTAYCKMVVECLVDESMDPEWFPEQDWQSPHDPRAEDSE